ncbi:MAG TPA: carboxymuconolactone decarboxylase family protein [Terriglobales bacterium]
MSRLPSHKKANIEQGQDTGPWDASVAKLRDWDPAWAEQCFRMTTNPWTNGILPLKTIELISIGVNAACTNLNQDGTRRHIRAALDAGATREEILTVLKMAALLGIHTCSLGAPILLEEAKAAGVEPRPKDKVSTPVCDKAREIGQWNTAWDPFFNLDPLWTEQFIATGLPVYTGALIPPKLAELLSIALDASYTHMYAPGTRRHIKAALKLGATMEEIMEVMKLCVVAGVQAFNLGVPILDEELERKSERRKTA